MTTLPSPSNLQPTGLMVLRVSVERGSSHPLRAHIRETSDVTHGFERSFVLSDVETTLQSVREWIEGLLAQEGAPARPPTGEPPVNGHV